MTTVLVTGAEGFIGSHLTEKLLSLGHRVRATVQYNSFNHNGWIDEAKVTGDLEIVHGDVRDPFFCRSIMTDVDAVFHLAALIGIPYSYSAPESYVEVNVKGTLNICQAAHEMGNVKIVQTSTSEVYGSARYVPIDESHPFQPQSPYSASKIAADAMAMSFYHSYDLPVIIARPFNTFGPRQSARAVIPTIISQLAVGKKAVELGSITPTRDFTYVEDTCEALIALSQSDGAIGKTVNIGSNSEVTIENLFSLINRLMNCDAEIQQKSNRLRPQKSEVDRLLCDNSLLISLTEFQPKFGLNLGLEKTISWFMSGKKPFKYDAERYHV